VAVVFSADDGRGVHRLFLWRRGRLEALPAVGEGACITPVFSPGGDGILFAQDDGHDFELFHLDLARGSVRRLTDNGADDYAPVFSPDGSRIAWTRAPSMTLGDAEGAEVMVADFPRGEARRLTRNRRFDAYPVFAADGGSVIVEGGRVDSLFGLFRIHLDGREEVLVDEPGRSGNGIPHVAGPTVVFERTRREAPTLFDVALMDLDDPGRIRERTAWRMPCNPSPRFSPDGGRIAFHRDRGGESPIVVLPTAERGDPLLLGGRGDILHLPRWSGDGRYIAAWDLRRHAIAVLDAARGGEGMRVPSPGPVRGQRFMEIYNFDIR
jgi:TolB protein